MREATSSVVDAGLRTGTIGSCRREDRAMLRSNPSAQPTPGHGRGHRLGQCSRSPHHVLAESDKPRGSGGSAPDVPTGLPNVNIYRVVGKWNAALTGGGAPGCLLAAFQATTFVFRRSAFQAAASALPPFNDTRRRPVGTVDLCHFHKASRVKVARACCREA
jgi:hypothetical protein